MRVIQNELVSFRCPNVLRERLEEYAVINDLHLSQVVRQACVNLVRSSAEEVSGKEPINRTWIIGK